MSVPEIIGNAFVILGVLIMAGFIAFEMNRWMDLRKSRERPADLTHRTVRRSVGALLLLVVLLLIKYPERETLVAMAGDEQRGEVLFALKYLVCLVLCFIVFVISYFDMRSVRSQIHLELAKDWEQTTRALQEFVREVSDKKPEELSGQESPKKESDNLPENSAEHGK